MTEPLSDKLNNQLVSRETGCGTDAQTTENNNAQSRNRFAPVFQIYLLTQFVIYYKKQLLRYLYLYLPHFPYQPPPKQRPSLIL